MSKLIVIFLIFVASVSAAPAADDLLITLPDGQIRGVEYVTGNNKIYYGFHGMPFATPPLGDLRFEAPQPPKPWSGILDGAKESAACMAVGNSPTQQETSEDCLYINVYTPYLKPEEKLPVMFWIYGGGFMGGSALKSLNGPDFLIEEDVILVTHNYRVGPFGLLSTGDEAIRGNAGMKDQVLALKWTRDNIALFGGDPDKVTIFGESAGGQSTGLQLASKLSAGLFRASIVQSGSALTNSSIKINPQEYAFQIAKVFSDGDYGNDTQKLKTFLQQKTAEEINNAAMSVVGPDVHAWPTLEVEGDDAFITESPYVLFESGRFNQVPTMIGVCAEESLMSLNDLENAKERALMLDTDRTLLIPSDLRPESKNEEAVATNIRNMYLKENETFSSNLVAMVKYLSDNMFNIAAIKEAELQSNYVPVYLYQFSYYGRTKVVPFIDGVEKATHGAEIPFLLNGSMPHDAKLSSLSISSDADDLLTQRRTVKLWTNFAKYLNPTPEETELFTNVIWPTTSPTNLQYLNINNTLEVRQGFKQPVFQGWNETYYTYGTQPFITF